jgi:hypothetical protein
VPTSGVLTSTTFDKALTFVMPPKKITTPGAALQPLDTNQDTLSLREARSQKPEEKGNQSNTSRGGAGPGDQGPRNHSPAGPKEKREDGSAGHPSEED